MSHDDSIVMALDVGNVRIGVATASRVARMASPLRTIANDKKVFETLQALLKTEKIDTLVVGLPRNLSGDDTAQTAVVRNFVDTLKTHVDVPIEFQDEALTSVKAEDELRARKKPYDKGDIDKLAASYILEDYLR